MNAQTFARAKRGNLVVFGEDHSSTSLKDGTLRYREWYVGLVSSTDREGAIKTLSRGNGYARHADQRIPKSVASFDRVNREKAIEIAEHFGDRHFDTLEAAAAAVKELLAKPAEVAT